MMELPGRPSPSAAVRDAPLPEESAWARPALMVAQLTAAWPVAWLIWRKPDAEVWTQLRHHLAHFPVDTAALADYIWLDFWIRPFGCDAALSQLVAQTFHERGIAQPRFCWHDPGAEGGSGRWHVGIRDLQGI